MLSLSDYLVESQGVSDDALYYRLGCYNLNSMQRDNAKKLLKQYNITDGNRAGIIKYAKEKTAPLLKKSKELIPRSQWDLNILWGETETQLMNPIYHEMINLIFKDHKKNHDILTVLQCSSKKPYSDNRLFKSEFIELYNKFTDFAVFTTPGTIPMEYDNYYPYRWDDWSNKRAAKIKPIVNIENKDTFVNTCRFLRYVREMGYKDVLLYSANSMENEMFEDMYEKDIEGAKDWLHIIINKNVRDKIGRKYPKMKANGFIEVRAASNPIAKEAYNKQLRKLLDKDDNAKAKDIFNKHYNESVVKDDYRMRENIDYKEVKNAFKRHLETNDGDEKYMYRRCYWTALDILMIAADGDLFEDVDKVYQKILKGLKEDSDFENFADFCFAYKPKMEDHKIKEFEKEAMDIYLIQKPLTQVKLTI